MTFTQFSLRKLRTFLPSPAKINQALRKLRKFLPSPAKIYQALRKLRKFLPSLAQIAKIFTQSYANCLKLRKFLSRPAKTSVNSHPVFCLLRKYSPCLILAK